jgi:outer membrane protein assembly factor BamB
MIRLGLTRSAAERDAGVARVALGLAVAVGLSACSGFNVPKVPGFGPHQKHASARVAPGQRIPVLPSDQSLTPAPALKGVDFALPPPQRMADWPVPGGNLAQAVDHVDAGAELKVAWRRKIGAGISKFTHIMAPPIVGDGHIFTLDGKARVTALDAVSGRELWTTDLSNKKGMDREAFGGGIAYGDGMIFMSSGYRFVAALDAGTGHVIWKIPTSSPVHGAPTVADGKVFVIDVVDQLQVYDEKTGASVWTYQPLEEPARMLIASSPAVSGEEVVAPFASGELVALSTANGTDLWTDVLSLTNRNNALSEIRDISGRPAIYRGAVYAGSHSGVMTAVDLRTGATAWSLPLAMISSPWPAGDVVYAISETGDVVCAARDSGQIYWIRRLNEPLRKKFRSNWSGPILASNRLLLVSDKGVILALDPHTGKDLKTVKLGPRDGAFMSPIATGGLLYILADDGELIAIR